MAANPDATPSGPSKAPPSGTESRWLPVTMAPGPRSPAGGSHQAHRLALRSAETARSRSAAAARNQERQAISACVNAYRR